MSATAQVVDVEDLTRLSVRLDGVDAAVADRALREGNLGELAGEHAWLVVEELRRCGGGDPEWDAGFTAMIRYAAAHDWLDDTATRVRAHVETGPPVGAGPAPGDGER